MIMFSKGLRMFQTSIPNIRRSFMTDPIGLLDITTWVSIRNVNLSLLPKRLIIFTSTSAAEPSSYLMEWWCYPFRCLGFWFLSHLMYPIRYQVLLIPTYTHSVSSVHSPLGSLPPHQSKPLLPQLLGYFHSLFPCFQICSPPICFPKVKSERCHQIVNPFISLPWSKPFLVFNFHQIE